MTSDFIKRIVVALLTLLLITSIAAFAATAESCDKDEAVCRIADIDKSDTFTYYKTVADAVEAAGTQSVGSVIELTRDVEMNRCLRVVSSKTITVTSAPGGPFKLTNSRISDNYVIENDSSKGELTLVNITVDGEGKFRSALSNCKRATLNIGVGTLVTGIAGGSDYGLACVTNSGTMNMMGGVIDGGEIGINNTYRLKMSGGFITDAKVGVYNSGKFALSGGVIRGLETDEDGTVKCDTGVENLGSLEMSGGSITNCAVRGIYNSGSSTLKMSGGEITDCLKSGGVYNYGDFVMSGGKIKNCAQTGKIEYLGGGVTVDGGYFQMSSGVISDCQSNGHRSAGGVGIFTGGTFEMSGGAISGCSGYGENGAGGVSLVRGTFKMSGGVIEGCKSTGEYAAGGMVLVSGNITVSGGEIRSCEGKGAYGAGGAVLVSGTLDVSGGRLSGCKGSGPKSAGGIGYNYGNLNISGGEISGCEGTRSGGVDMFYDSILNVSGSPLINGNYLPDGRACNILCTMEQLIKISGALVNATPIGVTLKNGVYITQLSSEDYSERFSSDDDTFATTGYPLGDSQMVSLVNQYKVSLASGDIGVAGFETSGDGRVYKPYDSPVKVKEGGELHVRALVNAACDFAGWTDGTTENPRIIRSVAKDMAFGATATAKDFPVSSDGVRGGSFSGNATANYKSAYKASIAPLDGYILPQSISVKTGGLSLDKFDYDPRLGTISVAAGSIMGEVEISCECPAIRYAIICDFDGGESEEIPDSYSIESPDITLASPLRRGYAFTGWSGDSLTGSDNLKATIKKGSKGDMRFKANWKPVVYRLDYDLNGGVTAKSNPSSYTIESDDFTLINPRRENYVFTGWSGTGVYGENSFKVTVPKGSVDDRRFAANWSPKVYLIEYDLDGGAVSGNPSAYTVLSDDIILKAPVKSGYVFGGWNTRSDGSGENVEDRASVEVLIENQNGGVSKLYAQWTKAPADQTDRASAESAESSDSPVKE